MNKLTKRPVLNLKSLRRWTNSFSGSGVDACYSDVSKHWGFKWYGSAYNCAKSYCIQSLLSEHGLCPKIHGEPVIFKHKPKGTYYERVRYGFITQKAIVLRSFLREFKIDWYPGCDYDEVKDQYNRSCQYADMGMPNFYDRIHEIDPSLRLSDLHSSNVGWLTSNGQGVIIDVGHFGPRGELDKKICKLESELCQKKTSGQLLDLTRKN